VREDMKVEKIDRVEWGCVTKIFLLPEKKVYLIYGPPSSETAHQIRARLESEGFDVIMLNEGVDSDAEKSRELRELALQHDGCSS
jgi:hypothetical protein